MPPTPPQKGLCPSTPRGTFCVKGALDPPKRFGSGNGSMVTRLPFPITIAGLKFGCAPLHHRRNHHRHGPAPLEFLYGLYSEGDRERQRGAGAAKVENSTLLKGGKSRPLVGRNIRNGRLKGRRRSSDWHTWRTKNLRMGRFRPGLGLSSLLQRPKVLRKRTEAGGDAASRLWRLTGPRRDDTGLRGDLAGVVALWGLLA